MTAQPTEREWEKAREMLAKLRDHNAIGQWTDNDLFVYSDATATTIIAQALADARAETAETIAAGLATFAIRRHGANDDHR